SSRGSGAGHRGWRKCCRTGPGPAAAVRMTAAPPPPSLHCESTRHDSHCLVEGIEFGLAVASEDDLFEIALALERVTNDSHRDHRGLVEREPGQSGTDRRQCHALATIVVGNLEGVLVRQRQQFTLV